MSILGLLNEMLAGEIRGLNLFSSSSYILHCEDSCCIVGRARPQVVEGIALCFAPLINCSSIASLRVGNNGLHF